MFNLTHHKTAETPYSKSLQQETIGPKADDEAPIVEKHLPHRDGYDQTTTEDQMSGKRKASGSDAQIIEKILNDAKGKYIQHRDNQPVLTMPPINALVEKIRQKRIADFWKPLESKEKHWSTSESKEQQGDLPKWPQNAAQHDKPVLQNDPKRFSKKEMVLDTKKTKSKPSKNPVKPLVGDITTADVDNIVHAIKTGSTVDYDTAILGILKQADAEKRELSAIERQAIVNLKKARTNAFLKK